MKFNFTIVIPHKNVPDLLERLILSIPFREDLEIIVVDDNSDTDVVERLRKLERERENMTLILNSECHGAGYARNRALPIVKGNWILFADADDFFNQVFNEFLDDYVNAEADIVYYNANCVDSETMEPSSRGDDMHKFIDDIHIDYKIDKKRGEMALRYLFTEPWCKMVKRELIEKHEIRFEETMIRNDVKFSYMVGYYSNNIIVDDRKVYCATTRHDSVSKGKGEQAALDELMVFSGWKKFLMEHRIPLELPLFELRVYFFTRDLWKNNRFFRLEYCKMREGGLSNVYIISKIIKYTLKSIKYKLDF